MAANRGVWRSEKRFWYLLTQEAADWYVTIMQAELRGIFTEYDHRVKFDPERPQQVEQPRQVAGF